MIVDAAAFLSLERPRMCECLRVGSFNDSGRIQTNTPAFRRRAAERCRQTSVTIMSRGSPASLTASTRHWIEDCPAFAETSSWRRSVARYREGLRARLLARLHAGLNAYQTALEPPSRLVVRPKVICPGLLGAHVDRSREPSESVDFIS
jgi:hypothetical protein